ncbi:MAG: UDP-N-acetylenolpyruvoylglucosamine reductase [Bacteroidetes bacterium 43-16]|nr:MAG: UDP-N-acetylenolpyruvoylglucosamine reductase [Bacteroidetes bacterium 43-16]
MINIEKDYALDQLNTFGMPVKAPYFSVIRERADCSSLAANAPEGLPVLILGGGSNMLFTQQPDKWVIKNEIKGIELIGEDETHIRLKVGAGEVWHEFVLYCIAHNYCGIENLALIPGTVGAAPIQNIGAYGVEVKQLITKVHYWDIEKETFDYLDNKDCRFGYRDSIFKQELKGKYIITEVEWQLSKTPSLNTSYGNIKEELDSRQITQPGIKDVAEAVIAIRSSKLPDPKVVGNAGSFFKNPEVKNEVYEAIRAQYSTAPGYKVGQDKTKIPAAWLIEQCNWKGFREGDAGVHPKQPLVLVNYGTASGTEIFELSTRIIASVEEKFGITLEREVQII